MTTEQNKPVSEHTPGPWKARNRFDIVQDRGIHGGYFVGSTRGNCDDLPENIKEQDEANARLIAAAPELLEALQEIVSRNEIQSWFNLDQARAAIAKATWINGTPAAS